MRRVNSFAISSTVSHMLNHKALVGILVLMMSLAFLVQLILVGKYYAEGSVSREENAFQNKTIAWSLSEAGPEQIERFIEELQVYQGRINEIIISSGYPLPPADVLSTDSDKEIRLITIFRVSVEIEKCFLHRAVLTFIQGRGSYLFTNTYIWKE